jgi:hypothetical protein
VDVTSAQSHLDYYRERQRDVVRAARHSRLAEAVEQSRRDERRGFLDRLHMRRLREAPAC